MYLVITLFSPIPLSALISFGHLNSMTPEQLKQLETGTKQETDIVWPANNMLLHG